MSYLAGIQIFTLVVSAAILVWQLREIRKATALQGFNALAEQLNQEDLIKIRESMYREYSKFGENKKWIISNSIDETKIRRVVILLDQLGTLVNRKLIPERIAIDMYWDIVIKCWDVCEQWILKERDDKRKKLKKDTKYYRFSALIWLRGVFYDVTKFIRKVFAAVWFKNVEEYKLYPKREPIAADYADTHYENFEKLAWRCERYCLKRGLNRPVIY